MKQHRRFRVSKIILAARELAALVLSPTSPASAQGVTTSSLSGVVKDAQGLLLPGVTVTVVHKPSGTPCETVTRGEGAFPFPQPERADGVALTLSTLTAAEEVTVVGKTDPVFGSSRTAEPPAGTRRPGAGERRRGHGSHLITVETRHQHLVITTCLVLAH